MKILLCNSYFYRLDPKQWKAKKPYPPLGTLYAAAALEVAGYDLVLVDNCLAHGVTHTLEEIDRHQPDVLVVYEDGFNYLTKMCLTNMREAAQQMLGYAQAKGITTICTSSDATDHTEQYLHHGADYIITGEAEKTLLELLSGLQDRSAQESILGIAYLDEGRVRKNHPRPVLKNLDELPDPAWHHVDFPAYQSIWNNHHGYYSLNIVTTRGCPFKCNWCAKPIYGNRYNSRSPARVVEEIKYLMELTGVRHFWVCDDIFGLKPGWVQEFSQLVQQAELAFSFKIQSRVDLLLKDNTIAALAAAGVEEIWVGAESGSQKILDAMDKGTQVRQIYEATRNLQKCNIKVGFFLQFGYLNESKEDIEETIKMLLELMPDDIGISVSYPLPGTLFYQKVAHQMQAKQNWSDSDDLAMMYEGTFSQKYYRRLHRYVHKLFRAAQTKNKLTKLSLWFNRPIILTWFYYWPAAMLDRMRLKILE